MEWKYEDERVYLEGKSGELIAEANLLDCGEGEVNIDRTFVNPDYRGQGLAGKLMEAVVSFLRENFLKATANCPYAHSWLRERRESHADVISDKFDSSPPRKKSEKKTK